MPSYAQDLLFANGDRYVGDVQPEYRSPPGRYGPRSLLDCERYDGVPVPNGEGVYTWVDGSEFAGSFVRGKPNGFGKYTGATGEVLEGEFMDGVLHGRGRMTHSGMDATGFWRHGEMDRDGVRLFDEKRLHEGSWKGGELWGRGRIETVVGQ